MKDKTSDKWIQVQSVAERLGCTDRYVSMLIQDGDLEAMKLGDRAIRVSEQSVDAFIARRKVDPQDYFAPQEPEDTARQQPKVARSKWMNR